MESKSPQIKDIRAHLKILDDDYPAKFYVSIITTTRLILPNAMRQDFRSN